MTDNDVVWVAVLFGTFVGVLAGVLGLVAR